ncbi:hypothetical protein SE17_16645 [Kouleothrix aurantiaca]|jgi:uncharacterized membrane protein (DUF2068 family)|uniref:Uncharacterized protein n=1 Tax=Kouleothrix aurantiaca TaxID=186479 RepID=A0A0P9D076_9CHLR|nr:hypothetical protein SE17_16645 [Kouleothrix aurantiaca]
MTESLKTETIQNDRTLPRGVYALASLLFLAGGALLLAAIILPLLGTASVPWFIYLLYGGYFLVIGYGLWGGKRWAFFATLLMCAVLGFYQFQNALVLGRNALFQVIVLAAIAVYMLQPAVRAAFLRPAQPAE